MDEVNKILRSNEPQLPEKEQAQPVTPLPTSQFKLHIIILTGFIVILFCVIGYLAYLYVNGG